MNTGRTLVLAVLLACLAASPAAAQGSAVHSDPNVAPRAVSGSPAEIEARRRQLMDAMMADPSDLDIAFEYAGLSVEVGDLEAAISTLERMLIFAPGLPRLQLELGVLYYRLGANEAAKSYFEAVLAQADVPAEVRARVEPYLVAINEGGASEAGLHGAILLGARYQTNANSAPSSSIVTLNGIDFVLGPGSMSAPDANGYAAANFRYVHDLESQGDKLVASLQAYGALYATQHVLDTGLVEARVGPEFNLERIGIEDASLGVYGIAGGVLLGGSPYLASGGVGMSLDKAFGPSLHGGATLEYRYDTFYNSLARPTAALRTGHLVTGSTELEYRVNEDVSLFAMLFGKRRLGQTGFVSSSEVGVTGGAAFDFDSPVPTLTDEWTVVVSGTVAHRRFDAPDPVINAAAAEVDTEFSVQGVLSVPLADSWSVQVAAAYRKVLSNYDLSRSTNVTVSAGAMKQF